jgi:hypothetical protein
MTNQQQIIGALAMDLKRVAMAKYDGSEKVAERFWQEVIKRKTEVLKTELPNYLKNLYVQIENNNDKDNLLMYSVVLQNYARRKQI